MRWAFQIILLIDFSIIALCIALIYGILSGVKPSMNITYDYGFLRCIAGFYTGILAAVSFPALRSYINGLSRLTATVLEWLTLTMCILFVVYCSGKGQFFVAPFIFAFVIVFASGKGAISDFMSERIFQYLAKISYSVYLVHVIIAFAFAIVMERMLGGLPTSWDADLWLYIYLIVVLAVSHCESSEEAGCENQLIGLTGPICQTAIQSSINSANRTHYHRVPTKLSLNG